MRPQSHTLTLIDICLAALAAQNGSTGCSAMCPHLPETLHAGWCHLHAGGSKVLPPGRPACGCNLSFFFFFFFQGGQVTRAESSNKSHPSKAQARGWRNLQPPPCEGAPPPSPHGHWAARCSAACYTASPRAPPRTRKSMYYDVLCHCDRRAYNKILLASKAH